jgi:hypothetical protein
MIHRRFDLAAITKYRYQRYQDSRARNGQFFFGPHSLPLYGAASFLYELYPDAGTGSVPDLATIATWFGARKAGNATGGWAAVPERIPEHWTNRVLPYTLPDVLVQIAAQYLGAPVEFGGNAGVGQFEPLDAPTALLSNASSAAVLCDFYHAAFDQTAPGERSASWPGKVC